MLPFGRLSVRTSLVRADSRDVSSDYLSQKGLRVERVQFETDRQRIVGDMTLPVQSYQSRFSDALNRADVPFVPLVDVEVTSLETGEVGRLPFLVVAKAHVRIAYPVASSSR